MLTFKDSNINANYKRGREQSINIICAKLITYLTGELAIRAS
jgi:hypothetical protein